MTVELSEEQVRFVVPEILKTPAFQSWLNEELAKAYDRGLIAGHENVARHLWEDGEPLVNPYRKKLS